MNTPCLTAWRSQTIRLNHRTTLSRALKTSASSSQASSSKSSPVENEEEIALRDPGLAKRNAEKLNYLVSLYHSLLPSLPLNDPALLPTEIDDIFTRRHHNEGDRPRFSNLRHLISNKMSLDEAAVDFEKDGGPSERLKQMPLPSGNTKAREMLAVGDRKKLAMLNKIPFVETRDLYPATSARTFGGGDRLGPREVFRIRAAIDALYGTEAAGRAGVPTIKEKGKELRDMGGGTIEGFSLEENEESSSSTTARQTS